MDPATATLALSALHFIVPYLKNVGDAATKKMGEKLFQTLSEHLSRHPESKVGLAQLQKDPDSSQAQSEVTTQLHSLLDNDPAFAGSVREILRHASVQIGVKAGANSNVVGQVFGNADFSRHGQSK